VKVQVLRRQRWDQDARAEGGGDFIDKRATQLGPCLTHSPGYDYPGGLKALESSNRQVAKKLPRVAVESSPFQTNRKRE
jgi:hypothetical protein